MPQATGNMQQTTGDKHKVMFGVLFPFYDNDLELHCLVLSFFGWKAEIKAAKLFVDAFSGTGAQAKMSVILYSGPRTQTMQLLSTAPLKREEALGRRGVLWCLSLVSTTVKSSSSIPSAIAQGH